jgi:hypothetical protein
MSEMLSEPESNESWEAKRKKMAKKLATLGPLGKEASKREMPPSKDDDEFLDLMQSLHAAAVDKVRQGEDKNVVIQDLCASLEALVGEEEMDDDSLDIAAVMGKRSKGSEY